MGGVTIHGGHRIQMAVDCECGTTVEARDEEELFDELLAQLLDAVTIGQVTPGRLFTTVGRRGRHRPLTHR